MLQQCPSPSSPANIRAYSDVHEFCLSLLRGAIDEDCADGSLVQIGNRPESGIESTNCLMSCDHVVRRSQAPQGRTVERVLIRVVEAAWMRSPRMERS